MASSENQDYVEASNNIQNNLYYEENSLLMIIHLCKTFKNQGLVYVNFFTNFLNSH